MKPAVTSETTATGVAASSAVDGEGVQLADKLVALGRIFFAVAFIGLAAEHFIFGRFVTGRAPAWPEGLPGEAAWAYASGAVILALAFAILAGKKARPAAILLAALVFLWALLRHIPVVAASEVLSPDYTRAVKALAFTGGALAIAATFPKVDTGRDTFFSRFMNREMEFVVAGRICLAVFMVNNGIQHFIYTEFVASLIPAWFPGDPVFWTYASAVFLFIGALGLLWPRTARTAALWTAIMVFAWVWIVHVPRTFASTSDNIAVFEALAMSGIALVLMHRPHRPDAVGRRYSGM